MNRSTLAILVGFLTGLAIVGINEAFSGQSIPEHRQSIAEKVEITQEQLMQMGEMFAAQQRLLNEQKDKTYFWYSKFKNLKTCVRNSKTYEEARGCTGEQVALNDHK